MSVATPLRDPTPPRLRADELAASLLREADAELRGDTDVEDDGAVMDVDSLPRLPPGGESSPSRAKGKAKGQVKGKTKDKGEDKGKAKKGKKGRGDVIPPPGNF